MRIRVEKSRVFLTIFIRTPTGRYSRFSSVDPEHGKHFALPSRAHFKGWRRGDRPPPRIRI
jgi:hypothetical protein